MTYKVSVWWGLDMQSQGKSRHQFAVPLLTINKSALSQGVFKDPPEREKVSCEIRQAS